MDTTYRTRQRTQLREQIYRTALELIRTSGYEGTTVEAIARRTGVSKGTFFNYFETKEHVVREWYRRMTLDALEWAESRWFDSAQAAILGLVDALAERAEAEPQLCAAKVRSTMVSPLLGIEEKQLDDRLLAYFAKHVQEGQSHGEVDPGVESALMASTVLATLSGTAHEWQLSGHTFPLRSTLAERMRFLLRAMAPRQGEAH